MTKAIIVKGHIDEAHGTPQDVVRYMNMHGWYIPKLTEQLK